MFDHRFIISSPLIKKNALAAVMSIMGEDEMEVIIKKHVDDKTAEQRNWFHTLCGLLSTDTGYTKGQMKELIKQEVIGTTLVKFAGRVREVTCSSEDQNKINYSELIEGAYRIGAEAGIVLPDPRPKKDRSTT